MIPDGLYRVTGCRACDEGEYLCEEHRVDCDHIDVELDDDGIAGRVFWCKECGDQVGLIGEEDEEGHPTWERL